MDPIRSETTKLAEMMDVLFRMCGDHPSLASKADLNVKEPSETTDKKDKDRRYPSYTIITPNGSQEADLPSGSEQELKPARSAHAPTQHAQILQAAALGAWRWAPYQLAGWALLVLTAHTLTALTDLLDAVLPPLRRACEYCFCMAARRWTQSGRARWCGAGAGAAGGALWLAYGTLSAARAAALWAVRPVTPPVPDNRDD